MQGTRVCLLVDSAAGHVDCPMLFLVELDHVESGNVPSPDAGRGFIEQVILPTLARLDQLVADKTLVSGGRRAGRVSPALTHRTGQAWKRQRNLPTHARLSTP